MQKQSSEKRRALRVGVFLGGRFIEEHLFWKPQQIRVGQATRGTDIVVPADGLPGRMTLFSSADGRFMLHVDRAFTARLAVVGDEGRGLVDVDKYVDRRGAREPRATIPLDGRMRGRVAVGEVTFLFHFVSRPRRPRRERIPATFRGGWLRGLSPISAAAIAISAAVQIGFLAWVLSQEWPQPLEADAFVENDFARILRVPPPEVEAKPPEPADNEEASESPSSKDAAAESADEPEADESPPAPTEPTDRLRMSEQVQKETIIGVIGTRNQNGKTAIGQMLADVDDTNMKEAFAGSNKVKNGPLDDDRLESGRDDQSQGRTTSIGGLERTDGARRGDGDVDTGDKAEEVVECQGCQMTQLPEDVSDPDSFPDPAAISEAIGRIEGRIQTCYDRQAKKYPSLAGKVVVTFTVAPRGSRGRVVDADPTVDMVGRGVGTCVAAEIRRLRLPRPRGSRVIVNKTFVFERGG